MTITVSSYQLMISGGRAKTKIFSGPDGWEGYPGLAANSSIGHHRIKKVKYDFRDDMTAYLMDLKGTEKYTVPHTVKHGFKEYTVTALTNSKSFSENTRKLSFDRFSAVKHICTTRLDNVEQISLPESLESIGYYVFSGNSCLKKIKLISENNHFQLLNKIMLMQNKNLLILARIFDIDIEIPRDIDTILPYACANVQKELIKFAPQSCLRCIDQYSFYRSKITSMTIPASCEIIEDYAFSQCYDLISITFQPGSKLKIIGAESFTYTKIKEIDIPSEVEIIETSAFLACDELGLIKFDKCLKLKTICKYAFKMTKLKEIRLPECLECLEEGVFQNCPIEIFEFNHNVKFTKIPSETFISSTLKRIDIPSSIVEICRGAFQECELETVTFEKNSKLEIIEYCAFYETKLKTIVIPENVKEVGDFAPSILEEVQFDTKIYPKISLEKIKNLKKIIFNNKYYYEDEKSVYSKETNEVVLTKRNGIKIEITQIDFSQMLKNFSLTGKITERSFFGANIAAVNVPANITEIESFAFSKCYKLKSIKFMKESKLKTIGDNAFEEINIDSIIIPSSVELIGNQCFDNSKIGNFSFEEDSCIEEIGEGAFLNSQIKKLTIPQNIERFGPNSLNFKSLDKLKYESPIFDSKSFGGEKSLKNIKTISFSSQFYFSDEDAVYSDDKKTLILVKPNVEYFNIGKDVSAIEDGCFDLCDKMNEIQLISNTNIKSLNVTCDVSRIVLSQSIEEISCFASVEEIIVAGKSLRIKSIGTNGNNLKIIKLKNATIISTDQSFKIIETNNINEL